MRPGSFGWAALAGLVAFTLHFAIPFAVVVDGPEGERTQEVWWPHDAAAMEADPVPGASMEYALAGLIVLTLGAVALYLSRLAPLAKIPAWRPGAATVTFVGVALTVHNQALWAGRSVGALVEAILGSDGPPARTAGDAFSGDYHAAFWSISPLLVLAAALACAWLVLHGLRKGLPTAQAKRHGDAAFLAIAATAFVLLAPWVLHTLDDANPHGRDGQDTDPFVITPYDAARIRLDTSLAADEQGEAGLEEYTEVAFLGGAIAPVAMTVFGLCAVAGLWGIERLDANDKLVGRTAQYLAATAGASAMAGWAIAVLTISVFFAYPNDRLAEDGRAAFVPVLGGLALLWTSLQLVAAIRVVAAETDALIADDFPEPIVYD